MQTTPTILVVDDEISGLNTLRRTLEEDFDVKTAASVAEAENILRQEWVQIIVCDQRLPDTSGVAFLTRVRDQWPDVIRMVISGYTDSRDIIHAINNAGIYQYITKPWQPEALILTLKNAARLYDLQRQNEALTIERKMSPAPLKRALQTRKQKMRENFQFNDGIVRTESSVMNDVCARVRQVAPYDVSVLLSGESGTGKELAARALHYTSLRWDCPFVVENCGALPDELLESELFGYKRGAFTGAVEDRTGLFERANGGTLFLDEIGEVSATFQVKLLRVLQEGEVRPLGSGCTRNVDVRVIAATNKNLEEEVYAGRFREDLYYRLATVTINLPALRERKTDIPLLAETLLHNAMQHLGKQVRGFTSEALQCMMDYHWPGNVRELQNEISHMLVTASGSELGADLLSRRVLQGRGDLRAAIPAFDPVSGPLKDRVEAMEASILRETLIRLRWNKSRAASELGLSRVGLRNKLERYGLEPQAHHNSAVN